MDLGELLNPQGQPTPGDDTWQKLQQSWNGIASDPRALGALLSMGGALVQPPQFGQTTTGHLLSGLGAAGDSVRTTEALDLKQREADSKAELRSSQASAQEARSGAASARNDTSTARLELARQAEEGKNIRNKYGNLIRYQRLHQEYEKQAQKENANAALLGKPVQPVLSFREWSERNPQLRTMLGLLPEDVGGGADASTPESTSGAENPPVAGARQAPDGKWYVPDPKRPGKYLMVQ